jgi:hypothetical protein
MERAIEFLSGHQAQLSADVQSLTGAVRLLTDDVQTLATTVHAHSVEISSITEDTREGFNNLIQANEAMRKEMREGFNNLILANEVTRELTPQVGKLAYSTSQRVTKLEQSYQPARNSRPSPQGQSFPVPA